ncbi:TIM9 translocase, partial [Pluvianellus socialis]|nr:TIM9 translocase [Pluvianellus socialis]
MVGQISEYDQIKNFKEFLRTYNKFTETCFLDCIKELTSKEFKPEEMNSSDRCLQSYLKMAQRVSMRFREYCMQQKD